MVSKIKPGECEITSITSDHDNLCDRPNQCPLCRATGSETIFSHARLANISRTYADRKSMKELMTDLNTDLCRKCGMLYRKPMMQNDQIRRYYREQYVETFKPKGTSQNKQLDDPCEVVPYLIRKKYARYFNFLARNGVGLKGKNVLDVGCGKGWLLAMMAENKPKRRVGIEPSRQRCDEINGREEFDFEMFNGMVSDYDSDKLGKFDVVTLIGVLEHLNDPIASLKACLGFMSHDSYLYVYTMNETPSLFIDMKKRISLVHVLYFTPQTLRIAFEMAGLEIIELQCRNTEMHILARKGQNSQLKHELNQRQYDALKTRYFLSLPAPRVQ